MDGSTHWIRPMRLWYIMGEGIVYPGGNTDIDIVYYHRFGEVGEVIGVTGHPLRVCRGESLVQSLLQFTSGLTTTLHCHFNNVPMTPLPFFQIFGDQV